MIRRHSNVLMLVASLALVAGSSAFAQTSRHSRRARRATAVKPSSSEQMSGLGFGVSESLSGTVQMVVTDQNLLVVQGPSGVPYDLKVTPKTVILIGDKRGTLDALSGLVGKSVAVGFTPQRDGNIATSVEVTG